MSRFIRFFILIQVLFLLSCTSDGERSTSLVNVFLTVSPVEAEDVVLELLGVDVQTSDVRGQGNNIPRFLPNLEAVKEINVNGLIAGRQYLLGRGEFTQGAITSLQLRLGNANRLKSGGAEFRVVNRENTPFEVSIPLTTGISHDVIIELDLQQSLFNDDIISSGNIILNPKLRAFSTLETGVITGTVSPTPQRAYVFALQGRDTLAITASDPASGRFDLRGLRGTYDILVRSLNPAFPQDTIRAVSVSPIQRVNLGNINLNPNP